jgi:hypothetical protein
MEKIGILLLLEMTESISFYQERAVQLSFQLQRSGWSVCLIGLAGEKGGRYGGRIG